MTRANGDLYEVQDPPRLFYWHIKSELRLCLNVSGVPDESKKWGTPTLLDPVGLNYQHGKGDLV